MNNELFYCNRLDCRANAQGSRVRQVRVVERRFQFSGCHRLSGIAAVVTYLSTCVQGHPVHLWVSCVLVRPNIFIRMSVGTNKRQEVKFLLHCRCCCVTNSLEMRSISHNNLVHRNKRRPNRFKPAITGFQFVFRRSFD